MLRHRERPEPCSAEWLLGKDFRKKNSNKGGGVHLGPLGTAATNRPIVPTPGDNDDGEIGGMMTGKGNRSTPRKLNSVILCPPYTPHALPGCEPGPPEIL
jgi:hypothetical protein